MKNNINEVIRNYIPLPKKIQDIEKLYNSSKYFECIIIGVQVLEDIAKNFFSDEKEMRKLYFESGGKIKKFVTTCHSIIDKQKERESLKLKLVTMIYELAMLSMRKGFGVEIEIEDANKLLHMVDRIINLRNDLAHNYLIDKKKSSEINRKLPLVAKECVELANLLHENRLF